MRHVARLASLLAGSATAAAALLAAAPGTAHAADTCTPSRAMIVLDKSSSMTATIGGVSKWAIAKSAIDTVATTFENSIDLGVMVFPHVDECGPGQVDVDVGPGHRDEILTALGAAPPSLGNWTPMAQTLEAAAGVPSLQDATRSRHVVLISDGWQWCSPYDASTRFDPVTAVAELAAMGVTTYVVGFGDSVDALALNRMAVAGGTALPGCDVTGATPTAAAPCYFRADNAAELNAALDSIATSVSTETCDGLDNDCDGLVDEDLLRACSSACGTGSETCVAGAWVGCDAPAVSPEICDGLDNDCDGTTDPACNCTAGQTMPCGNSVGACVPGAQTCGIDGMWGACAGALGPSAETCNGADDDCDGVVDGEVGGSSGGDDATAGRDLCPPGQLCVDGGCLELEEPALDPATPEGEDGLGDATGCACRASGRRGTAPSAAWLLLGLAGLGLVRARRQGRA